MKIKLLKSAVVGGYPGVVKGQVFDADDRTAGGLIATGMAVAFVGEASPAGAIETREPVAETRDPEVSAPKSGKGKSSWRPGGAARQP